MNGSLILEEQLILCLGYGVTFSGDLEPMGRFDGTFGNRINGPFDVVILARMHC